MNAMTHFIVLQSAVGLFLKNSSLLSMQSLLSASYFSMKGFLWSSDSCLYLLAHICMMQEEDSPGYSSFTCFDSICVKRVYGLRGRSGLSANLPLLALLCNRHALKDFLLLLMLLLWLLCGARARKSCLLSGTRHVPSPVLSKSGRTYSQHWVEGWWASRQLRRIGARGVKFWINRVDRDCAWVEYRVPARGKGTAQGTMNCPFTILLLILICFYLQKCTDDPTHRQWCTQSAYRVVHIHACMTRYIT